MSSRRPRLFTKVDAIDNDSDVSDLDVDTDDEYQMPENEYDDESSSISEGDEVADAASRAATSISALSCLRLQRWRSPDTNDITQVSESKSPATHVDCFGKSPPYVHNYCEDILNNSYDADGY
ncbi:hypothetical protein PoB_004239400 [Plakobranchus ocellatus]|uniref:Uncharacterized protein n=1 Tax=Plakobranchus ocellatus TaxID=259542 RepID=A0AAV4B747_9GAST|nr:hypothetical protein PoB_004239400 [Plakobranchus ocellatus]